MQELAQVLALLVKCYATFAVMAIGFGTMIAGRSGATAAGNFLLVRPLQWAARHARVLGFGLIAATWRFLLHRVVDPFILAVERAINWLVTRERGWLRGR